MQQNSLVNLSVQLYRILLYLYPAEHRQEYGWLMLQMFRDCARDAYQKRGSIGVLLYWFSVLLDVLKTVIQERLEKGFTMNTDVLTRFTHYFIMMAGALLAASAFSQLQPGDHYNFYGLYSLAFMSLPVALFSMFIGLWGFRSRYRSELAGFGKTVLLFAIATIGIVMAFLSRYSIEYYSLGEMMWAIMMSLVILLFVINIAIGLYIVTKSFLPRWSGLLLLVSGLLPFAMFLRSGEESVSGPLYFDFALVLTIGLCWIAFGYAVRQAEKQKLVTG